jgi:hypothetical protein
VIGGDFFAACLTRELGPVCSALIPYEIAHA